MRVLPARPTTVAAFIRWQQDLGVKEQITLETLSAIEVLHDVSGMANPVVTLVVRAVFDWLLPIEPPRAWTKDEKEQFKFYPRHAQEAIARVEVSREKDFRTKQNALAEERRRLSDGAAKSNIVNLEKELKMAKKEGWQKGEGVYSRSKLNIKQEELHSPGKGTDLQRVVFEQSERSILHRSCEGKSSPATRLMN